MPRSVHKQASKIVVCNHGNVYTIRDDGGTYDVVFHDELNQDQPQLQCGDLETTTLDTHVYLIR